MSDHDDTLLDEDLGDEEYDLCNDEEEALLADDYELERQNSYKGEEETDDVLDLGVTDALDDLEEDENIEYRGETDNHNQTDYYKEEHPKTQTAYYEQNDQEVYKVEQEEEERGEIRRYEENVARDNVTTQNTLGKGDLREKLQKNTQKDFFVGNGQGLEDDDCEEAKERRNRFQNERTIISPKMNNEIPDSLENVVTLEQSSRPSFRGRDRGRGIRGNRGIRGGGGCGRFNAPISSNFNPRFNCPRSSSTFDNQHPSYRPPLIDTRPSFPSGPLPNLPNQQILYPQNNPQMPQFQQFPPNGPAMRGPAPFVDNRLPFNPNAFQGPMGPPGPPGPRMIGPRVEFGPRGPMPGPPHPSYGCSPNQMPYPQNQQQHFQNQGLPIPDNHGRPPQGPPMQGNSGVPLHGNSGPPMPGNQGPPAIQRNPPGMSMQGFPLRPPGPPNQAPPSQNHLNAPGQPPFENRPPFQEPHFEAPRPPIYDSRPVYGDQPPGNQFNNGLPVPPQQTGPNVPNVPLPPGHKILINPHFRGAVQPTTDARLVWDAAQQQHPQPPPLQPQIPNDQLVQPPTPYQSQSPYNQSSGPRQNVQDYQPNYQQNKNDAYAYFSDVWQENKPQKTPSASSSKTYPIEASYSSRETSSYDGYENKYKSESQWEPREDYQQGQRGQHQNYRDREPPPRTKVDHVPRSRVPTSSSTTFSYRSVSYEQGPAQRPATSRPLNAIGRGTNARIPQKRIPESLERGQRDSSPKRVKPNSRNLHEVKTVDTLTDSTSDHKEEENEDPETREYLRRMEAQKRLREQLLREKENRRKMAAMEKQGDDAKGDSGSMEFSQQETKPVSVVTGVAKDVAATAIKVRPIAAGRGRGRPLVGASTTEGTSGVRIVRTIQTVQTNATLDDVNVKDLNSAVQATSEATIRGSRQLAPALCTRRVVLHKPSPTAQKVATTIQKTVLNLQKGQTQQKAGGNQQPVVQKIVQNQFGIRKLQPSGTVQRSNLNPQRVPGGLQKTVINVQTVGNTKVSAPNSQRVMLQKAPVQCKTLTGIKTNTVKIENLAASTTEAQIRRMCNGIGMLESIHVGEGNATIVFKTQSAALVFHKKYQRKMLDLSLITVRLVPQTVGNKASTVAVRTS